MHNLLRLDVGGGAVENDTRNALARIPLRWMVRQCFLADTGIMFNSQLLAQIGLDPGTLYPHVLTRPDPVTFERTDRSRIASDHSSGMVTVVNREMILTEEEEDLADILSPINDQLVLAKSWWLLEILPMKQRHQKPDGSWGWRTRYDCLHRSVELLIWTFLLTLFLRFNLASGRYIPRGDSHKIRVHRTVKLRMDAEEQLLPEGRRYAPRAKPLEDHRLEWVD